MINGRYIAYSSNGNCDSLGWYFNGVKEGPWHVYASNGRVLKELSFAGGKLVGKKDSTQINDDLQKWNDSASRSTAPKTTIVEIESSFPGGAIGWNQYLLQHMKYP